MQKLFNTVLDLQGRPVEGATLEVRTYPAGAAASIYSDDGTTLISGNVLVTDESGYCEYYAADGHYTWIITTDLAEQTISDIIHQDTV